MNKNQDQLDALVKEGDFLFRDPRYGQTSLYAMSVSYSPTAVNGARIHPSMDTRRARSLIISSPDRPLTDKEWDEFCERFGFKPVAPELKVGDKIYLQKDYDALPEGSEVGFNFGGNGKFVKRLDGCWDKFGGSRSARINPVMGVSSEACARPILSIGYSTPPSSDAGSLTALLEDAEARAASAEAKVAELLKTVAAVRSVVCN